MLTRSTHTHRPYCLVPLNPPSYFTSLVLFAPNFYPARDKSLRIIADAINRVLAYTSWSSSPPPPLPPQPPLWFAHNRTRSSFETIDNDSANRTNTHTHTHKRGNRLRETNERKGNHGGTVVIALRGPCFSFFLSSFYYVQIQTDNQN